MSSSRLALSSLLALAVGLTGCPPRDGDLDSGDGIACDLMAYPSVQVSLVDSDGAPLSGEFTVTYDTGDGPMDCDVSSDVVFCGMEVPGEMHIIAEADGFEKAEVDVVVDSDICHVITEQIDLEMVPLTEGD